MKNFKFMMVLFVMIAALCFTACESDKDDESTTPAPTCDPVCTGDTECKCIAVLGSVKCACVDKTEKEDPKPEECKCDPVCSEGKTCKCDGDKKECVDTEKPAEPKCDPVCTDGKECQCESDKCECVASVKPEECACDPICSDGKVCKCDGDKKECVDAPAEPGTDKK